jgi:uncharacterized caspase-like protein
VLRAVATNGAGVESAGIERRVTLKQAPAAPRLFLLAVGVSQHANARYNLQYAHLDAGGIERAVRQDASSLFDTIDAQVLTDRQATRAGILAGLERIVKRAAPQDVVVLFVAGHGVTLEQRYYFLPHDVRQVGGEGLASTGISSAQLADFVRRCRAQKVAILLDTCHAGASLGELGQVAMRGVAEIEEEQTLGRLARANGCFILAGSSDAQLAAESNRFGHGLFTQAMLEALGGKASCRPVTVGCLQRYAEDRLPALYREIEREAQYPVGFRFGDDFPLGR